MFKAALLNLANDLSDTEEVIVFLFSKKEADEHIENNESASIPVLTQEEWSKMVEKMSNDEGDWQELYSSFRYYIEQILQNRKKVADGNSGFSN